MFTIIQSLNHRYFGITSSTQLIGVMTLLSWFFLYHEWLRRNWHVRGMMKWYFHSRKLYFSCRSARSSENETRSSWIAITKIINPALMWPIDRFKVKIKSGAQSGHQLASVFQNLMDQYNTSILSTGEWVETKKYREDKHIGKTN